MRPYDRRDATRVFRERLMAVIKRQGGSQAAFARQIGVDRSTLSQLLSTREDRLPRADTVAAIAQTCQVSADWLLGLSQQEQADDAIIGTPLEIATDAWDPANRKLRAWHAEAAGYKVRYVPTTLPDLLKTRQVNAFEYNASKGMSPELAVRTAQDHLAYSRRPETDMEICSSLHALEGFAAGEGIWRDLPTEARHQQLETIATLADELYPTVRWFLFDALERYAPPMTIFGPKRAVLYTGEVYFVFNSTDHIRLLTQHFDSLIRSAVVQPPEIPGLARHLLATMDE
ncbi:MAG: helix-turn-helix transcriptional regulator [Rhodospirillales bacterium]|nr:helix-turn-helix transcriptional regulator [Rhodospirillales bacterium]